MRVFYCLMESSDIIFQNRIIFLIFNYIISPRIIAFSISRNKNNLHKKKHFFRHVVKGVKRKAPPPPSNTPNNEAPPPPKKTPPAKKKQVKRERPNTFMTREHFQPTEHNEFVVSNPDKVNEIKDLRVFFNDEKNRGVCFDYNVFEGKDKKIIRDPTFFVFNLWQEKRENLKNPDKDDGHREMTAKLKPRDIPALIEVCKAVELLNPKLFKNISPSASQFNAVNFVNRIMEAEAKESSTKVAEVEELDGGA